MYKSFDSCFLGIYQFLSIIKVFKGEIVRINLKALRCKPFKILIFIVNKYSK